MLSQHVHRRLANWKFAQAQDALSRQSQEATDEERMVVAALASAFGNSGWFDGSMGIIVNAALLRIGVAAEDGDDE